MAEWLQFEKLFRDDQTHFVKLVRHFFYQFFQNEFISQGTEARLTVIHILAVMAVPPVLYTLYLVPQYENIYWYFPRDYGPTCLIDHCRYVTFTMVIIGFVAVLEWDSLFLDQRDFAILTPLPLKPGAIFAAKITALMGFLLLFVVDAAAVPTILYPVVETMGLRGKPVSDFRFGDMVSSHAVAVCASGAFAFLFFVAIQGILLNTLSPRLFKKVSLRIQILAIITLLLLFFLLPVFSLSVPAWQRSPGPGLYWFPPLWFVGLYETVLGSADPMFNSLCHIALVALAGVGALCAVSYALNYKRHMQRALEATEAHPSAATGLTGLTQRTLKSLVLRKPLERATFFFVVYTLARSVKHQLYFATYVGAGLALAAYGVLQAKAATPSGYFADVLVQPHEALLAIPLIISFWLLSGLRIVFTVPAELRANWVFKIAEAEDCMDCCSGARKVLISLAALLGVSLFPIFATLWGWLPAFEHLALSFALSLILTELLLIGFWKIRFTCTYRAGKANLTVMGVIYWLAFTIYSYGIASAAHWLLQSGIRWLGFFLVTLVAYAALVVRRKRMPVEGQQIIFEDNPFPEILTLNLRT